MTQHSPPADNFPAKPGAYGLLIRLDRDQEMRFAGNPATLLAAGLYVYCGSAKGPGGLRARLGRHLKKTKKLHWHIDTLTAAGEVVGIWTSETATECQLVKAATQSHDARSPLPGFGSSDCRDCVSHLVSVPKDHGIENLFAPVRADVTWRAMPDER